MKARYAVSTLLLAAVALLVACGSGASSAATAVTGNWTITLTTQFDTGGPTQTSVFIMTLVPGSCSIMIGTITANGSSCSTTDGTGGSLSGTGTFFGSPEEVVIGASFS